MTKPKHFQDHPRKRSGRITTPSTKTMIRNIETILTEATILEYVAGLEWYGDAFRWACNEASYHNKTVYQIAQLTSILSPQTDWPTNKANVVAFLESGLSCRIFASGTQKLNCAAVLLDSYDIPQASLKTYSFAETIVNPTTYDGVVVDRHAIAVAFGYLKAPSVSITRARYLKTAEAYATVAKRHQLRPHQVQAITWVTYKRIVGR